MPHNDNVSVGSLISVPYDSLKLKFRSDTMCENPGIVLWDDIIGRYSEPLQSVAGQTTARPPQQINAFANEVNCFNEQFAQANRLLDVNNLTDSAACNQRQAKPPTLAKPPRLRQHHPPSVSTAVASAIHPGAVTTARLRGDNAVPLADSLVLDYRSINAVGGSGSDEPSTGDSKTAATVPQHKTPRRHHRRPHRVEVKLFDGNESETKSPWYFEFPIRAIAATTHAVERRPRGALHHLQNSSGDEQPNGAFTLKEQSTTSGGDSSTVESMTKIDTVGVSYRLPSTTTAAHTAGSFANDADLGYSLSKRQSDDKIDEPAVSRNHRPRNHHLHRPTPRIMSSTTLQLDGFYSAGSDIMANLQQNTVASTVRKKPAFDSGAVGGCRESRPHRNDSAFVDPLVGAPAEFHQRISALASLQQETIKWERMRVPRRKKAP